MVPNWVNSYLHVVFTFVSIHNYFMKGSLDIVFGNPVFVIFTL